MSYTLIILKNMNDQIKSNTSAEMKITFKFNTVEINLVKGKTYFFEA